MISSKVANTISAHLPPKKSNSLKIKLSGAALGIAIRSRWGKTRIGDTPGEGSQSSWVSPEWGTPSGTC